jgi:sensor c-di-GMP phosphodiesterase-like protein
VASPRKPLRAWWGSSGTLSRLAGRTRMLRDQVSLSHRKMMRIVIAGAVGGGLLALSFGVSVVERSEEDGVRREALALISAVRAREAEVSGVLVALDRLQNSPCSIADLTKLRAIVLGSTIILDIVRRDHGRLACSAVYGNTDIAIPALAQPGVRLSSDQTIWRYANLPSVPGHKFIIVGHNEAFVIVRPSGTPPDFAPEHLNLSRFFVDSSSGQISWFAGKPVSVPSALLKDGSRFWHAGSYVTVACATDRMMCLALQAPWLAMFKRNAAPFEFFVLAGGLTGSAASLSILTWLGQRRSIQYRLRKAVQDGELVLHYQPIFDVRIGEIVAAEALMRWPVGTGVCIGPDEFIPIAEESGMIGDITCLAIRRVSEELGAMLRLRPSFLVSINIAADDFGDKRFHAALAKYIVAAGISPSQIALELTERRSAEVEAASTAIRHLRRAGYKIYIDDFGTGYSSLTYLSDLTIDAIKLDRSFTSTVNTGVARARLVTPILEMAKDTGVPVIVEGVETSYQETYFRERGVLRMQGTLFGKPVEAARLMTSIHNGTLPA